MPHCHRAPLYVQFRCHCHRADSINFLPNQEVFSEGLVSGHKTQPWVPHKAKDIQGEKNECECRIVRERGIGENHHLSQVIYPTVLINSYNMRFHLMHWLACSAFVSLRNFFSPLLSCLSLRIDTSQCRFTSLHSTWLYKNFEHTILF